MLIAEHGKYHLARRLMMCALHIVIAAVPLGTHAATVPETSVAAPLLGNIPGPFEEQLIPSRDVSLAEREALENAVRAYNILTPENVASLEAYLIANPDSPYHLALRTNMGLVFYRYGYFSRAMAEWQAVWQQREAARSTPAKPLVDRAIGELIKMNARLGRAPVVEALMAEASSYRIAGPAVESIAGIARPLSDEAAARRGVPVRPACSA